MSFASGAAPGSALDGAGPDSGPTTVVYITGSGRSGSTLLERILGAVDGFVNIGELNELFRRVAVEDERCGAGEPFSACPFWQAVGERAFGGWDAAAVRRVAQLQRAVARQRRLPQLLAPARAGAAFRADLEEYLSTFDALYAAVAAEAGASVVVDASKGPAQALALSRSPHIDLRVLHLIRDGRGVAHSWAKAGVARPQAADGDGVMAHYRVPRTATHWAAFQAEAAVVSAAVPHAARLRYEDLVADPDGSVRAVLERLGLSVPPVGLPHVSAAGVTLPVSHGLAGNPGRFTAGFQRLRVDEEWRRAMAPEDRLAATLIGLPQLVAYGYLGRAAGPQSLSPVHHSPGGQSLDQSPGRSPDQRAPEPSRGGTA